MILYNSLKIQNIKSIKCTGVNVDGNVEVSWCDKFFPLFFYDSDNLIFKSESYNKNLKTIQELILIGWI